MVKLILSGRGRQEVIVPNIEVNSHKSFKYHNNYNLVIEKTDIINIDSSDSIIIISRKKNNIELKGICDESDKIYTYIDFEDDETKNLFLFKLKRHLSKKDYKQDRVKLRKHSKEIISEINQDLNLLRCKSHIIVKEVEE